MSYITIQNVRDSDPTGDDYSDYTDAEIQAMIDKWQSFIETQTGNFFEIRNLTLNIDGTGGRILHLPTPIIDLQQLQINKSGQDEDLTTIIVYNGRGQPQDDRKNPKIALDPDYGDRASSIYSVNHYRDCKRIFRKGYRNQLVKGNFGYVESDDSTPIRIQDALLRLVQREINYGPDGVISPGITDKEVTDGHSISYATKFGSVYTERITGDPVIDRTILDYKAPAGVGITLQI